MPRKRSSRDPESGSYSAETRKAIEANRQARGLSPDHIRQHSLLPLDTLDAMVGAQLFAEGIQFRFTPDRDGQVWAKACIRTSKFPRHYIITSFPAGTPFSVCVEGLLRKVEAFHEGELRPSPDTW